MNLLKIAHVPPLLVNPDQTVLDAVDASIPAKVGAVAVVEGGRLVGVFTERDVMVKVVHQRLDPGSTPVRQVMTAPVITVPPEMQAKAVLELMLDRHIRHLPVSEDGTTVMGMLSLRNILQYMVEDLRNDLRHLEAYMGADSPGG
jgi:CBS domain-containing protein